MLRAAIVYFTLTDHTWEAACYVAEGLEEQDTLADVLSVEKITAENLAQYAFILLASPSHFAKPAEAMMNFLGEIANEAWSSKLGAALAVHSAFGGKNVVSRLEQALTRLGATVIQPGLVVRAGVPLALRRGNPLSMSDIERCIDFGERLARLALRNAETDS